MSSVICHPVPLKFEVSFAFAWDTFVEADYKNL